MIVVTGTKRSGTSMWMQVLAAAGYPVVGDAFPSNWGEVIRAANPRGFFESRLAAGVYFATNPDPNTGSYLAPSDSQALAVKVFAPGVVRSDIAFLDRVIATVRPWHEFTASLLTLRSQARGAEDLEDSRGGAVQHDPILEWWNDNYVLVRDAAARRYPVHFQTYASLLRDPEGVLAPILEWLGETADLNAAVDAVEPDLHRNRHENLSVATPDVPEVLISACDDLYAHLHEERPLDQKMIDHLNNAQRAVFPLLADLQFQNRRRVAQQIVTQNP
jgi:hypothetical protein